MPKFKGSQHCCDPLTKDKDEKIRRRKNEKILRKRTSGLLAPHVRNGCIMTGFRTASRCTDCIRGTCARMHRLVCLMFTGTADSAGTCACPVASAKGRIRESGRARTGIRFLTGQKMDVRASAKQKTITGSTVKNKKRPKGKEEQK